jgi:hypothetical protein
MKKTNVYSIHSVSWSFKSLITGVFLLAFMALSNLGTAQYTPPTPADVLPKLKAKDISVGIARVESKYWEDFIHNIPNNMDPNNHAVDYPRYMYNAWQFIILQADEPTFEMPTILALLYGVMHTDVDGTTTHSYGFYSKSWNKDYVDIVNKLKI